MFTSLLRSLFSRSAPRKRPFRNAAQKSACRLAVERLEDRTVPTAVAPPSGLVSWWTANNTAADLIGGNNATLTNGTAYATGEVGTGFNFDGVNDAVALGDPSSLAFTGSFTIEGWVKVNALPTNYNFGTIMFRGDDRGGLDPYVIGIQPNGNLQFQIDGIANGAASVAAPIPLGQFVHVAATLDDATGEMTLYENGAVVAQLVTTVRPFANLDPTQNPGVGIGNSNYVGNYDVPFNGVIDELSVYNRALTPGEVLAIDKAGSSGKVISPISVDGPSVLEGAVGTTTPMAFTITRTGSLSGSLSVNWTTADDSASAGTDYVAASGTATFAAGQATTTVQVTVNGDNLPESNEDFKLIATPVGGTSVMGVGIILNDDASISISNDVAVEGSPSIRSLGAFVPAGLGGLADAYSIVAGPDGNVYVSVLSGSAVYRYDAAGNPLPAPGQSGATFVAPGSGGLSLARGISFGPDGNLYVVSQGTNAVLRYDPVTGAPAGALIAAGAGGLDAPRGILFRDGYAYVVNTSGIVAPGMNTVMRFNAVTGAPAGVSGLPGDAIFIASGSGGLFNPSDIVFGPDGMAYVSSTATTASSVTSNSILRYNPVTGAPAGISGQPGDAVFVSPGSGGLDGPVAMVFRPDGYLYVTGFRSNSVLRYYAATGAFSDTVIPAGSGGLSSPMDLLFSANGNLLVTSRLTNQVLRYGAASQLAFTVSLAAPSAGTTTVNFATADGTALAGSDYIAASGTLAFPAGLTTQTIVIQTLNDAPADGTETFFVNLSNPVGASLTNTQGVGTIIDSAVTMSITDATVVEADAGTQTVALTVSLSRTSVQNITVNYATANGTATTANNDYNAANGTLTFAPGETSKVILLTVNGDTVPEQDETFFVNLTGATNVTVADAQGKVTLLNNDFTPTISYANFSDVSALALVGTAKQASNLLQLTPAKVNKAGAAWYKTPQVVQSGFTTTFQFQTSPGDGGFVFVIQNSSAGTAAIGAAQGYLGYAQIDNKLGIEFNSYVNQIKVSNGASVAAPFDLNDNQVHTARIEYLPSAGGNGGTLQVFLDNSSTPTLTTSVDLDQTVNLATGGKAWVGFTASSNGYGLAPYPSNEIVNWKFTPYFVDNTVAQISISDVSKAEGKKNTTTVFTFTVTLSQASTTPVTMSYQTVNGTATVANSDYVAQTGTITFAPGETTKTISITVNGDNKAEDDELFYVDLSGNSSNSLFAKSRGIGTILNDD